MKIDGQRDAMLFSSDNGLSGKHNDNIIDIERKSSSFAFRESRACPALEKFDV